MQAAPPKISVGCRCTAACSTLRWTRGVPGGRAESPAEIAPPEKALPPPARWPSAPAGRFHGGAGRAERDAGAFRGQTGPDPRPAAPVPGPQSGLGALGAERHPLQPGRCLPPAQPELPCGKGQRVYTACISTKVLRKYQRDGYRWLRTLDGYGMGGILADDMGLGKTVQVLSYLLALREQGGNPCPASSSARPRWC